MQRLNGRSHIRKICETFGDWKKIHMDMDWLKIMEKRVQRLFAVKRSPVMARLTQDQPVPDWPKSEEAL